MAYIVQSSYKETPTSSSASYTVNLPATGKYAVNDLLVVYGRNQGGATTITTASTGWTIETGQAQSGNNRGFVAWKIATSTSETDPVFSGATNNWTALSFVVKDAPTSSPISVSSRAGMASGQSLASGTPSTGTDADCLALYFASTSGTSQLRALTDDVTCMGASVENSSVTQVIVGYRQLGAAGNMPAVTFYWDAASSSGEVWAVAVKNNGSRQSWAKSGLNEFAWMGGHGSKLGAITHAAASNFAATVNSITVSTVEPTYTVGETDDSSWGQRTKLESTENSTAKFSGTYLTFASAIPSMTGKLFSLEWMVGTANTASQVAQDGFVVGFRDASGNYVVYQIRARGTGTSGSWVANQWRRDVFEIGVSTAYATSGSIDWANVTGIMLAAHRTASTGASIIWYFKNLLTIDAAQILGGGANAPATFNDAYRARTSCGIRRVSQQQGSAQVFTTGDVQIGDGSLFTYFDSAAQAFEFPLAYDSVTQREWHVAANKLTLGIYASASDTIKVRSGAAVTTQSANLTINSSSSTSATYDFAGQSFVGWLPTWKTGVTVANATFQSCGEINFKGANVTNCTITGTTSTDAACAFDTNSATMDGCTIDVTGTSAAYHLELGASVTGITLTDVTFTGTPGTDKVHVLATTGTVTITINGSTSLVAGDVTSAGATVVISSAPVNQTVTISNLKSGSRVQIYDTTSSTELANATGTSGDVVFTGTDPKTAVWTDPAVATASRAIRVRISYVSGSTAAKEFIEANIGTCGITAGTEDVSYVANQVDDDVYIANAIDGSAVTGVTFTDSGTDVINIDVVAATISWKTIYAAWVYYAFTSTGIASDIDYIEAKDTANYTLSNLVVKNTSSPSVPLEVTGGYGVDAVTGATIDLVDSSGGTLVFAPEHVTAYATGSALTGTQDSNLSDARSAAILARKLLSNKRVLNAATGVETIYDDDGTALYTRNVYEDAAGSTLYDGTDAPHRVEKYT